MSSKSEEITFESFEYRGVWWLPGKTRRKVAGTLTYNIEDGAMLELIGSFEPALSAFLNGSVSEYPIILGMTANGKEVTLHDCSGLGSELYAQRVFVGAHFPMPARIRFRNLSVTFLHLREWAAMSRIISEQPAPEEFVLRHRRLEPISISLGRRRDLTLEVESWLNLNFSNSEASMQIKADLNILPAKPLPFQKYLDTLFEFQNFLSLATGHSVTPLAIQGETEANKFQRNDDEWSYPDVRVYFEPSHPPRNPKRLIAFDMLFTLNDVGNRLEAFINNWFTKAETLKPVYDLYFGALRNEKLYSDTRFLFMVQALESYARRAMPNKELLETQHAARIRAILDAVPVEHMEWLEGRLAYSNEPNLRKRLRSIIALFPEPTVSFLGKPKDFISRVVSVRNYLTHYDPGFQGRVPTGEEYHSMALKLRLLLEMCLLREIGFTGEEIANLTVRSLRSRRYRFLSRT